MPRTPALCFVVEAEALAVDVDDDEVVKDAIEHRHGEYTVAATALSRLPDTPSRDGFGL
jgi:hypothetical protein